MIRVAGVDVRRSALTKLALTLRHGTPRERYLANRIGQAIDGNWSELPLHPDDRAVLLAALEDPPAGLEELRAVLLQEFTWRQREGLG